MAKKQAAQYLVVSASTIERRSIPWQPDPQPGKIRTRWLILKEGGKELPRYYGPDVVALLSERPRSAFQKVFGRRYELTLPGFKL
jgi:hypothetical protein